MILLYPSTETAFADNGLGALSDAISCTVTEARNGEYELQLEYPLNGIHYGDIANRCVVTAKPNPYDDPQPFRIYRITRPLGGRVTLYAQHISYDLSGATVSPFSAGSAQAAMAALKQNAVGAENFTFLTDIASGADLTVSVPTSVRSVLGGQAGSLLDVYGGEYEWDRYTVRLLSQRGQDSGVTIRYGKNLTSLEQDENIAGVATGVYPYWAGQDGELVTLPEKTVDAPGTYDYTYIIPLDLSGEFEEAPGVSQLRERAEKYVEDNRVGVPKVSITVAFQPLEQTEEYKEIALLERVNLCDTVTVEYPALGVSATAKCVRTVYDVLKGRYTSVELGDARTNLADTIVQQQQEIDRAPTASAMQQAILNATNLITGSKGGYVVLRDTNGDKEPDEILIMDSPSIADAQKIWRWNSGGLGYSSSGYNGPYGTAITQDGSIVANYITTGILNASVIKTGRIVGQANPNVYFDLDSGEISASTIISPQGDYRADIGTTTVGDKTDSGIRIKGVNSNSAIWYTQSGISSTRGSFDIVLDGDRLSIGESWFVYNNADRPVIRATPEQLQLYQPDSSTDFIQLNGGVLAVYLNGRRVLEASKDTVSISGTLNVVGSLLVNGYPVNP